jgi:hypothetical protein
VDCIQMTMPEIVGGERSSCLRVWCDEPSTNGGACDGYFRRVVLDFCIYNASDVAELRLKALRGGRCNLTDE